MKVFIEIGLSVAAMILLEVVWPWWLAQDPPPNPSPTAQTTPAVIYRVPEPTPRHRFIPEDLTDNTDNEEKEENWNGPWDFD